MVFMRRQEIYIFLLISLLRFLGTRNLINLKFLGLKAYYRNTCILVLTKKYKFILILVKVNLFKKIKKFIKKKNKKKSFKKLQKIQY